MVRSPSSTTRSDSPSLKIALALALLRSNKLRRPPSSSATSGGDAERWKRKAKERKREILRLKEELKQLEDGARADMELPVASCRCHFFDGIGELGGEADGSGSGEHWIDEVLRRRFLRLVRWNERKKKVERPVHGTPLLEFNNKDEIERLSTSVDFLVEFANIVMEKGEVIASFATFSHQATDFICASLKTLVLSKKGIELIEEIVNGMITRLTKRMCSVPKDTGAPYGSEIRFGIQHLIRRLGNEPFIGQRVLLLVSQKIMASAESLLFVDPFDESFPVIHGSMFLMIQLTEFVVSDSVKNSTSAEAFDKRLFEEWVRSLLQVRKASELLESKNGLYALYIQRVIGELAKLLASLARQDKIYLDILSAIFR